MLCFLPTTWLLAPTHAPAACRQRLDAGAVPTVEGDVPIVGDPTQGSIEAEQPSTQVTNYLTFIT